jgi:hypothetical protein
VITASVISHLGVAPPARVEDGPQHLIEPLGLPRAFPLRYSVASTGVA